MVLNDPCLNSSIWFVTFSFSQLFFSHWTEQKILLPKLRENTFWLPRKSLFSLFSIAGAFQCGLSSFRSAHITPRLGLWTFMKLLLYLPSHNLSTPPSNAPKTSDMFRMKLLRLFSSAELGPFTSVVFVFSFTICWFTFHRLIFYFSHAKKLYFSHRYNCVLSGNLLFHSCFRFYFYEVGNFYDLNDDSIPTKTFRKALLKDERKISAD